MVPDQRGLLRDARRPGFSADARCTTPTGRRGMKAHWSISSFVAIHFNGEDPVGRRITPDRRAAGLRTIRAGDGRYRGRGPDGAPTQLPGRGAGSGRLPSYRADPQRFVFLSSGPRANRVWRRRCEGTGARHRTRPAAVRHHDARPPARPAAMVLSSVRRSLHDLRDDRPGTSALGLYALTAYAVVQRTAEIGVRMALGAQPKQIVWLILKRSLLQMTIGLPVGIAGAFGVGGSCSP